MLWATWDLGAQFICWKSQYSYLLSHLFSACLLIFKNKHKFWVLWVIKLKCLGFLSYFSFVLYYCHMFIAQNSGFSIKQLLSSIWYTLAIFISYFFSFLPMPFLSLTLLAFPLSPPFPQASNCFQVLYTQNIAFHYYA